MRLPLKDRETLGYTPLDWCHIVRKVDFFSSPTGILTVLRRPSTFLAFEKARGSETNVIFGSRREVDDHCALLGCYAASSGISLPMFRDILWAPY